MSVGEGEIVLQAGTVGAEPGASLRLCPNGDIFVNGRLAANDTEVVEALRAFLVRACGPSEELASGRVNDGP